MHKFTEIQRDGTQYQASKSRRTAISCGQRHWGRGLAATLAAGLLGTSCALAVPPTPGGLIVIRVGDGSASLAATGAPIELEEYSPSGSLVFTTLVPRTGAGSVVMTGSAANEGGLMRSPDGKILSFAGYNTTPGTALPGSAATSPRTVCTLNYIGVLSFPVSSTTAYNSSNFRSAATDGQNNYWGAAGSTGGTIYFGTAFPSGLIESAPANTRVINIQNGNLCFTVSSGTAGVSGIYAFSGTPVTAATATQVIATTSGTTAPSPYGYAFSPDGLTAYVADDRTVAASGGMQKWVKSGGTWSNPYILVGTAGCRGIAVDWSGANPIIYATTSEASANKFVTVTDTGAGSSVSTLATAPANTAFRGVAFAPVCPTPTAVVRVADSATVCVGEMVAVHADLTGTGPWMVTWSDGSVQGVASSPAVYTFNATVPGPFVVSVSTVTDGSGCRPGAGSGAASMTVNSAPMIGCPGNMSVGTDAGVCGAVVTFVTPATGTPMPGVSCMVTANDGGGLPVGTAVASGSVFAKGSSTVTCRAENSCGSDSCMFTVTVSDMEAPVLSGCSDKTVMAADGSGAVVTYTSPTATDNCPPNPGVACNPASGSTFAVGATMVSCVTQDAAGNPASCSFKVTVSRASLQTMIDNAAPGSAVQLPAGDYGCLVIDKSLTVTATGPITFHGCSPALTVSAGSVTFDGVAFTTATDDPTVLVEGTGSLTLKNCVVEESTGFNQVGIKVTETGSLDLSSGDNTVKVSGMGSLIRNESANPINAIGTTLGSSSNFEVEDLIFHAPDAGGGGLVTWVANNVYVTPTSGSIQRGIDAVASGGRVNIETGSYEGDVDATGKAVTLSPGASPGQVTINGDLTLDSDDTLFFELNGVTPGTDYDQFVVNGAVALGGATLSATSGFSYADCATLTLIDTGMAGSVSGTFAGLPNNAVVDVGGQLFRIVYNGSEVVLILDTTPPEITCGTDKTVECGTVWTFDAPSAGDNCGAATVAIFSTTTNFNGCTFTATRTWVATDGAGNTNTCSQNVTVVDATPPTIGCAADFTVECGATWSFTMPTATDVCGGANVTIQILGTVTNATCGNTFTATRTWSASDGCGNSNTCSQTATVVDTTPPAIACAPDFTVECGTAWAFVDPTATDLCDGTNVTIQILGTVTNTTCGSTFTATRTWSASDGCGNSNTCSQTATVADTAPPTIVCAPDFTVECGTAWAFVDPTATDLCDGVSILMLGTVTNATCGGTFTATRTWSASDGCGNSNTCSQTVTLVDTTPPAISCAPDFTVECGTAWAFVDPTATDLCDGVSIQMLGTVTNTTCGSTFTATRTWSASDGCGNSNTCSQTVTVVDTTPPAISCAPDFTVECGTAWAFTKPTAIDVCDGASVTISILGTVTIATCGNTFTATRRWSASDGCGNSNICSQTVVVVDTTPPAIACAPDFTVECGTVWAFVDPTATDICEGTNVTIQMLGTVTNTTCGSTFTATRTWSASDGCGNSNTCSQTATVVDTTPPTISCAPDFTVECGTAWAFVNPTATDLCDGGNVTIQILGTVTNAGCGSTFTAIRTWSASDGCGNSNTCSQTVTVVDTTPPTISCAPDFTVECGTAWAFTMPTAIDVCDGASVTIQILGTVTNTTCGSTFTATRTWSAIDGCGNSNTCSQTVTVVDTTPPTISCGPDFTVECGTAWTFTKPTATDVCDGANVTISILGTVTNATCGNTFTATRTWSASDGCGNSNTCSQTATVVDMTPPTIGCVPDFTVECGTAWGFVDPTATDICDGTNVTIQMLGTVTNTTCGSTFTATRTWSATDSCGNSNTCSQTATVVDTAPPTVSCSPDFTVECGTSWTFTKPSATDVCDGANVTIQILGTVTNTTCGSTFTATRTWSASDGCGNSNRCSQAVTVVDTTPPTVSCSPDFTVECGTSWTFTKPSATDVCDGVSIQILGTVTNTTCGSTFTATRTWSASDGCGNSNTCSQTVTVVDTTPPAISCVPDFTVECGTAWTFTKPTATDVCDGANVTIHILGTVTNAACGSTFTATRTWSASDGCGNSNICSQTATVVDTTPPAISCAPDFTVECATAWAFTKPTATDVCDGTNVTIHLLGTVTNATCGRTFTATRTWSASDRCGNSNTCSQTATVVDTTPPALTCPAPVEVAAASGQCSAVAMFTATATDVCSSATIQCVPASGSTFPAGTTTVICHAWDECNNTNTCSFTVQVLGEADLSAQISTSGNSVTVGEFFNYYVTVNNAGPCLASALSINTFSPGQLLVAITNGMNAPGMACPTPGPVAWWPAEGNAADTAGLNDGTLHGGVSFAAGKVGQAFDLDGLSGYVSVPDAPGLRPTSLTIEGWMTIKDANGRHVVIGKANGAGDSYSVWVDSGVVYAAISDGSGSGPWLSCPVASDANQWFHIAYTFDRASHVQALYVDGALTASGFANKSIAYDGHDVLIGAALNSGSPDFFYQGEIDELSLYDRALSGTEINAIYHMAGGGKCPSDTVELGDLASGGSKTLTLVVVPTNCAPVAGAVLIDTSSTDMNRANNLAISSVATVQDVPASQLKLTIERVSQNNNAIEICWPLTCAPYALQGANSLNPPAIWSPAIVPMLMINGRICTVVPASEAMQYYLLRSP